MGLPSIQQTFDWALQHHQAGRLKEAEPLCRQVLAQQPEHTDALHMLGVIAAQVGRYDAAIDLFRQAIALRPGFAEAYNNLGNALQAQGQVAQAVAAFRQAIALKPNSPDAYYNMANGLKEQGQLEQAIAAYQQAIILKPNLPEAYNNLGNALREKGRLDEAIAAYHQAVRLKPDRSGAYSNLGNVLSDSGQMDQAIAAYRQAIALKANNAGAHSNLVYALHYRPDFDAATIAEEHRRWNRQHAEPLKPCIQPYANDGNSDRRLRVGYLSADFRDHVVARFILPLLANHDHRALEVFAYAQVSAPDTVTQRLRAHTDAWRSLVGLTDTQAAELIRQDRIDILVDLGGHTGGNRLLVFAHKPAPVQVTYLGYPNTTGLSTMDYRLTDAYADPPGQTELYHSEQLFRLSPCAWCFPPLESPPVTVRQEGPITFGCFNNFAKVTQPMLKLWGRVLWAVPESRLLLKSLALGCLSVRQKVQQQFAAWGIDCRRLDLHGQEDGYDRHLALYGRMDIALDTFPYHGTTTTCEAIWMGVPVVSLAGSSHVSRVGVSLLNNIGLPELVADSEEQYLQIAVNLANDLPRLQQLRSTLRPRMQASPLMDAPRFARNIEAAYRQMWRQYCSSNPQ